MRKNELLEELEQRFLKEHQAMDEAADSSDKEAAIKYGHCSCAIAQIIGLVKFGDDQIDQALEYLYKKYNLYRYE